MTTDHTPVTEQELAERTTAPRVTEAHLDSLIAHEYYHVPPGTTLTLCVLTLRNGYTVVGESACADPRNFKEDVGRRYAYQKARNRIWALEGYALRSRLAEQERAS